MAGASKRRARKASALADRERKQLGVGKQFQAPQSPSAVSMALAIPNVSESDQSVVTLKVGPHGKIFLVHTNIICDESEFFGAAFRSAFKEGKTQVMELEDTEEEVFKVVMHWLYARRLPEMCSKDLEKFKIDPDAQVRDGDSDECNWDYLMSSAYVFSKTYAIPALSHAIDDSFEERFNVWIPNFARVLLHIPSFRTITRVFNNVPEDSRLCQLFVFHVAKHWGHPRAAVTNPPLPEDLPANFLSQTLKAVGGLQAELYQKQEVLEEKLRRSKEDLESKGRELHCRTRELEAKDKELKAKDQRLKRFSTAVSTPLRLPELTAEEKSRKELRAKRFSAV